MLHFRDEFRFVRCIEVLKDCGLKLDDHTRWLDLGCRQGQLLRLLVERYGVVRPLGMDDWSPIHKPPSDHAWDYLQADFAAGIPASEQMDVISALEVLEHVIDTDRFLEAILARLKPGGWLLLSTPNINSLRNRVMVPFGVYPVGIEYRNVIHHVRLYNPGCLVDHLSSKGFRNIRTRGVSFLPIRFFRVGRSWVSQRLADALPQLCNNFIAVATKPA